VATSLRAERVALLGFGVEGAATLRWLRREGFAGTVSVLDDGPRPDALDATVPWIPARDAGLEDLDLLIKTPGIKPSHPAWQRCLARGLAHTTATNLYLDAVRAAGLTVVGVTLGLHRLVAHRGFDTPQWVERLLVLMGAMACQSGPIEWVGLHRHHHLYSDQSNDHHDAGRGLWWAHSEWMLHDIPALREIHRFTGDLERDPFYRWLDHWFLLLQLPLGIALYLYGEHAGVRGGGLGRSGVIHRNERRCRHPFSARRSAGGAPRPRSGRGLLQPDPGAKGARRSE
jgi:hypothetical protein